MSYQFKLKRLLWQKTWIQNYTKCSIWSNVTVRNSQVKWEEDVKTMQQQTNHATTISLLIFHMSHVCLK